MTRQSWIFAAVLAVAAGFVGWEMYNSLTPATHADHDHGLANLDGGGFLRVERAGGGRRNLVGRPGKVFVLHWFDPAGEGTEAELVGLRDFAAATAADVQIEVAAIAVDAEWPDALALAERVGLARDVVYLDPAGDTSRLFGVRRLPETLVYDPEGRLAFQSRGPVEWGSGRFRSEIQRARLGVEEIH